jgi:DNA-binding MarR family transcriptional regulator
VSDIRIATGNGHELDAPPWRRFESTLMATSKSIRRAFDLRLSTIGLNLSEACLLEYVFEHGPMTQTQAAEKVGMQRASAGTIIDNLSKRNLLRRLPDPTDQRVWLLSVTSEGRRMAAQIAEVDHALRLELRRDLSKEERGQLADMLLRLQINLDGVLDADK